MHKVFDSVLDISIIVFLDNFLIFIRNKIKHLEHIYFALENLRQYGLKAKYKLSSFSLASVEYLKHTISAGTIQADLDKVSAAKDSPKHKYINQLQIVLRIANYHKHFIRHFVYTTAPLTELPARNISWSWFDRQQSALEELKDKLTSTPILYLPNFDYYFILETDASAFTIGVALMQDKCHGLQPAIFF